MLVNSLEYLYQTLKHAEAGALYSTDKLSFMIDSNLNDARDFLVSIIKGHGQGNKRGVELAFKILLLLGIVRSNVEDLLIVATLLEETKEVIDLRPELDILIKSGGSASSEDSVVKKLPKLAEIKITKSGQIFFLNAGKYQQEIKARAALTSDGEG